MTQIPEQQQQQAAAADNGELDRLVASLHDELGDRLTIDYAGPMPAYSFVG